MNKLQRIKQLNERLRDVLNISEMMIEYGDYLGTVDTIKEAIEKLQLKEQDCYKTRKYLRVKKMPTEQELKYFNKDDILKNIPIELSYQIVVVWGEPDIIISGKRLEGHGLKHILQKHKNNIEEIKEKIDDIVLRNVAILDKRTGNFVINTTKFKITFCIDNYQAILLTAYKK